VQTLVLDVAYRPVDMISWEDAIVQAVVKRTVEVIDQYPDRFINTVNWTVNMPSVVRLLTPIKKNKAVKFSRYNVYARDKCRCQYCGTFIGRREFTLDHVRPRAQGGTTTWENVVTCCVPCNQQKGQKSLAQSGMKLRSMPVKPKKLPDVTSFTMQYKKGMPESWRDYLRSAAYWDGELENDE
jgi:5-methylcytosine-specific restriction endonuclease McrA